MFGQETHRIYQKKACYEERLVASFGVSPLNCHSSLCAARQSDKESPLCEAQNKMKMPNLTHFVRSGHDISDHSSLSPDYLQGGVRCLISH